MIQYWQKKVTDPTFHSEPLGGAGKFDDVDSLHDFIQGKSFHLSKEDAVSIRLILWMAVSSNPLMNLKGYHALVIERGFTISRETVR